MGDISSVYGKVGKVYLKEFEAMQKNQNKYSDKVYVNSKDWVTKLKFQDMDNRFKNFKNKEGKKPNYVSINLGSANMVRTYDESVLKAKAIDIINETRKLGKNPDRIHIRNRENGNLDVLSKKEYMGLYENRNIFWINNNYKFPKYTTLNTTANNPVKMDYQNNSVNCGPASMSMASQMLFKNTTEQEFASVCKTDKNGTDPKNLALINKLGFSIKPIGRNSKAVKEALNRGSAVIAHIQTKPATCLGYLNDYGHYVLIDRMNDSQYHVCDPTKGIKWCNFNILDKATNGRSIQYYEMKVV